MIIRLATLFTFLIFAACSGEDASAEGNDAPAGGTDEQGAAEQGAGGQTDQAVAAVVITEPEVHDAICGHALEDVGSCGNYVSINGEWMPIEWPELGTMEWCSKDKAGAKIEITGEMKDGKFVATSYKSVE